MKVEITYEVGPNESYPITANIRLPDGTYACASGKDKEAAKYEAIARAKFKTQPLPPPEIVEI